MSQPNQPPGAIPGWTPPAAKPKKPIWQRWWFIALVAIFVIGGLGRAFGGGGEPAAAPTGSPTAAPTSATLDPSAACIQFPMDRAKDILDNKGMTPNNAAAVRSTTHKDQVYYVAIRFHGDGVKDAVGIWATTDVTSGATFAVDGFAHQFSDFPQRTDAFDQNDASAQAAKKCVA